MTDEKRFCALCDQSVRLVNKSDKIWGKGENAGVFIHVKSSEHGVPGCGRQFLREHQTYTEGDSDLNPPSETQY